MSELEVIGLDLGTKKTGVARVNGIAKISEPLKTLPTEEVLSFVKSLKADAIVVGLPRNLNGQDTQQTVWVREWVDLAKKEMDLPFYWIDEALTSKISEERKNVPGGSKYEIDSLAAAMIAEDFINSPEAEWVRC